MNAPRGGAARPIVDEEPRALLDRAEAPGQASRLSPEQARAILDQRARVLARIPAQVPDADAVLEVATFTLHNEQYAIETRYVRRIARLGDVTPVPGAPDVLRGVTNSAGEIFAVFDLSGLLGGGRPGAAAPACLVVLGGDREEFGVLADAVHEVVILKIDEVLPPPSSLEGLGRHLLRGVTENALIVIEGDMLLHDERLIINQGEEAGG